MAVKVLFFGATADIAGTRTLELPFSGKTSTADFLREQIERFPGLASHKLHLSINQQYATGDEMIKNGDELAIFTPVSGG